MVILVEAALRVTVNFVQEFHPGKDSYSQKKAEHLFWDIRTKYYICTRNKTNKHYKENNYEAV